MADPLVIENEKPPARQSSAPKEDSLLAALVFMTGFFGHARSADALQAGLAVDRKGMTPKLLCHAAERAGLKARVIKKQIDKVPAEVMPVLAMLKSKDAVVILQRLDKGLLRVLDPVSREEKSVPAKDFSKIFSGYLIYVKPDYVAEGGGDVALENHWFWSNILESRGIYIRVLVASLLINIFALTSSIYIMNFYNRVLPNNAIETGWVLSIGAASVFIFDFMMRNLRAYFIDLAGRRSDVVLAQRLYNQVLDMCLGQRTGSIGAFANNMREFEALREFFNSATMTGLVDFPFSLIFIAVIWLIAGPQMALLLLTLFATVLIVGYVMQIPVQKKVHQAMKTGEQKHGLLVETIGNIETIRGVGGEGALRANYGHYVGKSAEAGQQSRFYSGLSVHFSILIQQLSGVLIVLFGMYLIADKEMTVGALMACVILGARAISPIGQVAGLVNKYHQARSAYRSLDTLMRMPVERPRDKKFLHRPVLKGNFHLKDVEFAYPRTLRPVLQGLNVKINPLDKVAVIGRIGSGKSSLIKMLVGFYEPVKGTILVDETDMRQIDPADLRRNIAYMGQDTSLMSGTIRENIVMGLPRATDAEVLKVAELAGVHDFVRTNPMGYDSPVGERGEGLSGGQRQAVALARTLLMNTPVLILDEPTNAMDSATEDRVLRSLEGHAKNKTLILVTHKTALLRLVNRLIVVDNGRVVMDGPRDQVLQALAGGKVAAG